MKKNKALRNSDILYHIIKGWRMILLFTLIGLIVGVIIIGAGYIRGEVTREYQITSSFAIITPKPTDEKTKANNIQMSKGLTETAIYIVKSEKNIQSVVENLGLRGVSAADISKNLTLTRYNDTEVVEMKLLWRSEKEGLKIMSAINRVSSKTIAQAVRIGSVSVINEPRASFIVGGNISISTWIYAALLGFLAGIGICILRFLISPTLINEIDVQTLFGISTLGSIPLDKQYARSKPSLKNNLAVMDDVKSVAHLLLSHLEAAGVSKLYITSTTHFEGKTRLLADIALQFSRLGKKTLLVDCDLANPRLGALFYNNLKYEQTLNSLYRGESDKLDAIIHINGCLDILPTVLEKNPETLNDPLLAQVARVMDGYDYVLIDAAPVGDDAEVLRRNEIVDTVLYVVRYDYARVDDIKRSMLRIAKSSVPVVGSVFNFTINWRQAIINAPKRLATSLRREEKKKKKEEKERGAYQELRSENTRKARSSSPATADEYIANTGSADIEEAKKRKSRAEKRRAKKEAKKNKETENNNNES